MSHCGFSVRQQPWRPSSHHTTFYSVTASVWRVERPTTDRRSFNSTHKKLSSTQIDWLTDCLCGQVLDLSDVLCKRLSDGITVDARYRCAVAVVCVVAKKCAVALTSCMRFSRLQVATFVLMYICLYELLMDLCWVAVLEERYESSRITVVVYNCR